MTNFFEALQSRIFVAVEDKTKLIRDRLRIAARRAADHEIEHNLLPFISSHYMNISHTPSDFSQLGVQWASLSPMYAKRREREHQVPQDIFWKQTGNLLTEIKDARVIKAFGQTSVQASLAKGDDIQSILKSGQFVRQLVITPFPHVRQQLLEHNWALMDKWLYEGDDAASFVYRKLANRKSRYRPLLGPAMLIFAKRNIARAVAAKLKELGYEVK